MKNLASHFKLWIVIGSLLSGNLFPASANADPSNGVQTTCSGATPDGLITAQVNVQQGEWTNSYGGYDLIRAQTILKIDGKEIPSLTDHCLMTSDPNSVPRCSHDSGEIRCEVYPKIDSENDKAEEVDVIVWRGDLPELYKLKSCQNPETKP